jgi:hypothetical protein
MFKIIKLKGDSKKVIVLPVLQLTQLWVYFYAMVTGKAVLTHLLGVFQAKNMVERHLLSADYL